MLCCRTTLDPPPEVLFRTATAAVGILLAPELLPREGSEASAAKVLQETCDYIRSLHREVDDLSERLSDLLADAEVNSAQAAIIRSFLN
ncbi:hypothetical protein ZIOFF_016141 [Zingiber officinale]|uniref:Uncharacterized protein n=1 Tax=Zingiber officinale TaxID=94328 RepID=A0A8J5HSA8_ZINOF|nr:hypothetical protein ZIOFF_016141 [Zingiber officinale]